MCRYEISCSIFGNARTANYEGDVYVFFVSAGFARRKAVLADVKAVILEASALRVRERGSRLTGRVDDIGIIKQIETL